ncbi:MAG: hypothetical protein AAFV53_05780 [Myxococcota bacterium]
MRILLPISMSLALLGCRNQPGKENVNTDGVVADNEWTVQLELSQDSVSAGLPLTYTVTVLDPDEQPVTLDDWALTSSLEPDLSWSYTELTPIVAGEHGLTLNATTDDGTALVAEGTFNVVAGPAYDVDLVLDDNATQAGVEIGFRVEAVDQFGNAVDVSGASVTVDSEEILVDANSFWSTVPGTYVATAAIGDSEDVELFVVTPGPADSIALIFNTAVELYQTVTARVRLQDAYGNDATEDWTLSVDGDGETVTSFRNVTFYDEGFYTVTATVDGRELSDSVGPFLIDSTGPELTIYTPERGGWSEGLQEDLTGNVYDEWSPALSLSVNGRSFTANSDGDFTVPQDYAFGLNVLETTAIDGDNNSATDTRAVLAGGFLAEGERCSQGVQVRLHEGTGGLDTLEELGEGLISGTDLDALLPSPVFSDSARNCFDPCGGLFGGCRVCVTWYAVNLYVTNPRISGTDMDLDPQSNGRIGTLFAVNDPSLRWSASGTAVGIGYSGSGDISARDITVDMEVEPFVDGSNNIQATLYNVNATANGFDFNFNGFGWLEDVFDFFGVDIDALIAEPMLGAVEDILRDEVPAVLADALQDLELSFDVDLFENVFTIDALPEFIDVDNSGITLAMETDVAAGEWVRPDFGLGSLYAGYQGPEYTGSPGAIIGMSDDFLNQFLYQLWGGGALDLRLDSSELGLNASDLEFILGDIDSLTIVADPLLPPVVVPGDGNLLDLQIGDLLLTLYADEDVFIEVYVSAVTDLDVSVEGDQTLAAAIGEDIELYFDVIYPEANTVGAADTEALLEAIVPLILPSLTDALGAIEIPSIEGFTISTISVDAAGPENGVLTLGGNLTAD